MTTSNDIYIECYAQQNKSDYCKIVELVGEVPEQNTYLYDLAYFMYFIAFLMVVISPIIILFKIIKGATEK